MSSDGGDRADDLARFGRHLIRGESSARGQHRPQDADVVVGQRHSRLLPAYAGQQLRRPPRGIRSRRLCAVITAGLAPWINSVRR